MTSQTCESDAVLSGDELHQLADLDECDEKRLGSLGGTLLGIVLSAILWAGLILTSAALFR